MNLHKIVVKCIKGGFLLEFMNYCYTEVDIYIRTALCSIYSAFNEVKLVLKVNSSIFLERELFFNLIILIGQGGGTWGLKQRWSFFGSQERGHEETRLKRKRDEEV